MSRDETGTEGRAAGPMRAEYRALAACRHAPWMARARAIGLLLTRPVTEVLARIPVGARVLDFGAGDGLFTVMLADAGCAVTAVEPDPVRLGVARQVSGDRPGVRCAAGLDEFDGGRRFDCVLIVDVIYLVPPDERLRLMERLAARLSPGGRAVIKEVIADGGWREELVRGQERLVQTLTTRRAFQGVNLPTAEELDRLARVFGPIRETVDLPIAWYLHRCIVAGGVEGARDI